MKILWLKYCAYMCQPQTYKIAKCLSEFSKTGLNKEIPREGTRTKLQGMHTPQKAIK